MSRVIDPIFSNIIDEIIEDDINDYMEDLVFYMTFNKRLHRIELEKLDTKIGNDKIKVTVDDKNGAINIELNGIDNIFVFSNTAKNGYYYLLKVIEKKD